MMARRQDDERVPGRAAYTMLTQGMSVDFDVIEAVHVDHPATSGRVQGTEISVTSREALVKWGLFHC
jgi:hypothetical protein